MNSSGSPLFSICTPTYNNKKTIHRVTRSLEAQTFRNFEWLVIDDGSTDGLDEYIREYREYASFPVQYYRLEENSGKPTAMNLGIAKANGELFIVADGDDEFVPEALQIMHDRWMEIPETTREGLSGLVCSCIDQHGEFVGTPFPESPWIADIFEMRHKYKVAGEKWGFNRTDVLKEHLFNTDVDRHLLLTTVWNEIGFKYKAVHINDALRIYYRFEDDGNSLTSRQKNKILFPEGMRYSHLLDINRYYEKIKPDYKELLYSFLHYIRMSVHTGRSIRGTLADVVGMKKKCITAFLYPVGWAVAVRDKLQGRI